MKWGWQSIIWTVTTLTLVSYLTFIGIKNGIGTVEGIVCLTVCCSIVFLILWMPLYIKISGQRISLRRLSGTISIKREDIAKIERISSKTLSGSFRIGSGGVFGYWGKFNNENLGWYTLFATELKNLVLIETNDLRKYVISSKSLYDLLTKDLMESNAAG